MSEQSEVRSKVPTLPILTSYIVSSSKGDAYCLYVGTGWYRALTRGLVFCIATNGNIVYSCRNLRFLCISRAVKG